MVPPMRTMPKSLESLMFANAIEFVIEIVGTYNRQCTNIRPKKGQNVFVKARANIATPPTRWLKARNFSAAKLRSAN